MVRSARWTAAPVVALLLLVGTLSTASAAPVPLPSFYDVPSPLPAGPPGTIIKSEQVSAPGLDGTTWRVMYKSQSIKGVDIPVTGLIVIPNTPAPVGGYPVISWAHGTTGIADECAPSLNATSSIGLANSLLDKGYLITATDYEGLGTPGRHPYIVGVSEANGVIDIVRAARLMPDAHASSDYVVWGHSQGGHAAMFALHGADARAPELHLKGVVAGAPPSQLGFVYDILKNSPYKYYLLMVGAAINAAYGDVEAPLGDILNAQGLAMVNEVDNGCTGYLGSVSQGVTVDDLMVKQSDGTYNPASNPVWGPLIQAQDPANFKTPSSEPLLIIHGGNDEQIPTVSSQILAGQLCATGQDVERWMYPGRSHAGVIAPSMADMTRWIGDRFAGVASPDAYVPTGQPDIDATVCVKGVMVSEKKAGPGTAPPVGQVAATPATPVTVTPAYTG